jgi:hypothetical protein
MNKKFFSFGVLLAIFFAAACISCRKGDKGEPGQSGNSGSKLLKDGSITGSIVGFNDDATSFTVPFKYEYFKTPTDNVLITDSDGFKHYIITRYDEKGESFIKLEFRIETVPNQNGGTISTGYGEYATVKVYNKENNDGYFYFGTRDGGNRFQVSRVSLQSSYSTSTEIEFENLTINPATGNVNFDYSINLASKDNSTGNSANITGTITVNPYNTIYRTGDE